MIIININGKKAKEVIIININGKKAKEVANPFKPATVIFFIERQVLVRM